MLRCRVAGIGGTSTVVDKQWHAVAFVLRRQVLNPLICNPWSAKLVLLLAHHI